MSTLPPTPCAPWCHDGSGHTDADHPEDQWCGTHSEGVELDAEPLSTFTTKDGDKLAYKQSLDAYLSRAGWSTRTLVNLTHNGLTAIHLTPAEAVTLGEILTRLGRLALEDQSHDA